MGASNSKPADGTPQHIFTADSPVSFSNELVETLQKNPQTDSTRLKNLELQIQSRLTAELERLHEQASASLAAVQEKLASETADPGSSNEEELTPSFAEKLIDTLSPEAAAEKQRQKALSSDFVSREIEELRRKLASRKKIEQVDESLGKAKEDLVQCLRLNDRRPLDCWQEVEAFRKEVGRLERVFVEKTVR